MKFNTFLTKVLLILIISGKNLFGSCEPCGITSIGTTETGITPVSVVYSPNGQCVTVANLFTNPGTLNIFRVNCDCSLTAVGSPVATGGVAPASVAYSPNGQCLAVANLVSNNVSIFRVNCDCSLTPVGSPIPTGGTLPIALAYSPNSQCLAVANSGSNNVSIFRVNSDCSLIVPPIIVPVGTRPSAVAYSPNGQCLAVANAPISPPNTPGSVSIFRVNADCSVTPVGSFAVGFNPASLASSPNWQCLAVANRGVAPNLGTTVSIFRVDANCSLTSVGLPIPTGGIEPASVAYSPNGSCLAVANVQTDNVSIFRVNADCTLLPPTTVPAGDAPASLRYSPGGQCLAVANFGNANVQIFRTNLMSMPVISSVAVDCDENCIRITGRASASTPASESTPAFPINITVAENGVELASTVTDSRGNFEVQICNVTSGSQHIFTVTARNPNACTASQQICNCIV